MFYSIYTSVKTALSGVTGLKATQWFNMQYDATIAISPVAFIEFPDEMPIDSASKDVVKLPYKLRIHVVSKVIAGQDGQVPDAAITANEQLAIAVKTALSNLAITGSRPLRFAGWRHWQRYNGFMITYVDFTGTINQV